MLSSHRDHTMEKLSRKRHLRIIADCIKCLVQVSISGSSGSLELLGFPFAVGISGSGAAPRNVVT